MQTSLGGQREGLVERFVKRPPEWEEAMRALKAALGRGTVSDRTASDRLKALGLRYVGKTGETQGGPAQGTLQLDCVCEESTENDQCATICGECGGVRREVRAVEMLRTGDLCAECGQGGGSRARCGGCGETRHVVLRSEPEHDRKEGMCKLHSRQHQHVQGEWWLCPNCFQRHAKALYEHKRRPQGPAGYLRGETMEEYRRLPTRARGEEERGGKAGPCPTAGETPVGEDEGGNEGTRREGEGSRLNPKNRERKRKTREPCNTQEDPGDAPQRGRGAGIVIIGAKEKPAREGSATREHYLRWRK